MNPMKGAAPYASDVFEELIRLLYRQANTGTKGNLAVAVMTAVVFYTGGLPLVALVPLVGVVLVYLQRVYLIREFQHRTPPGAELRRWHRYFFFSSLAGGIAWAIACLVAYPLATEGTRVYLIVIACGLTAAGIGTLAASLAVYNAYLISMYAGVLTSIFVYGLGGNTFIAIPFILYVFVMRRSARESQRTIAESVQLSLEKRALVADLIVARDRAEEAQRLAEASNSAKSDFLAKMSHEIRTPMNGILGMTELLLTGALTGEERVFAETAHQSGEALMTIINDILDHSKLEAGKMSLEQVPFELEGVVEDVVALFGVSAAKKGLILAHRLDRDVPARVTGDATRLRQVLANLVGNALKFTDHGEIEIRASVAGEMLSFSVRDTGMGMDASTRDRLFTAFEQADNSISRRFGGTGLGLAIVKQLVELMQGQLHVESELGQGSEFHFTTRLPAAPALSPVPERFTGRVIVFATSELHAAQIVTWVEIMGGTADRVDGMTALIGALDAGATSLVVEAPLVTDLEGLARRYAKLQVIAFEAPLRLSAATRTSAIVRLTTPLRRSVLEAALENRASYHPATTRERASFRGARILVADDNAVNRMVISGMLGHLDCAPQLVADGEAALEALSREEFDLVLMDCEMPRLDGLAVTREIRRTSKRQIVVALTAHALEAHRERCLEAGMNDVLTKPVSLRTLEQCLTQWVGH
mgnify:CR=1 FL=1